MTTKWTVSYERISFDRYADTDDEAAGVDRQRADNELIARAKGRKLDKCYRDNSISALDESKEREDFERLIRDVEAGKIGMIIVWHIDRLAVRSDDLARLLKAGRPHGVTIASVHGVSIDMSDPTGVAVATILVAIAEMERRHKGIRHRAANRQRAQQGKVGWVHRPFGYDRDEHGQVFVVDEEARALRYVAGRVLDPVRPATLSRMCRVLNRARITGSWRVTWHPHDDTARTRDFSDEASAIEFRSEKDAAGGVASMQFVYRDWQVTPLRQLLLNPRHAGRAVLNGEDFGVGQWPPIFDEETADRLSTKLRDPRRRTHTGNGHKHELSGIAKCSICINYSFPKVTMYATPQPSGSDRYILKCRKGHLTRLMAPVEQYVHEWIITRLSQPDVAQLLAPVGVDAGELNARHKDLRQRRDAIAAMLADGLFSEEAARSQARRLTEQIADVEREIDGANGTGPLAELVQAHDVPAAWDALDLMSRREVIDLLVDVVILPAKKGRFDRAGVRFVKKS